MNGAGNRLFLAPFSYFRERSEWGASEMKRSEAVARIQDGLGFAERQEEKIVLRLLEAQRDLEKGKTLPRFLLREDAVLDVVAGAQSAPLPQDFIRIENEPWFSGSGGKLNFVEVIANYDYEEALSYYYSVSPGPPKVAIIRNNSSGVRIMDFFHPLDRAYALSWGYYGKDDVLTSDIENRWLKNSSEWLIGEAGRRMAMDLRDKDAIALFTDIRQAGRAATFGEELAQEDSTGPVYLGSAL